jgi:hypothetical protein
MLINGSSHSKIEFTAPRPDIKPPFIHRDKNSDFFKLAKEKVYFYRDTPLAPLKGGI